MYRQSIVTSFQHDRLHLHSNFVVNLFQFDHIWLELVVIGLLCLCVVDVENSIIKYRVESTIDAMNKGMQWCKGVDKTRTLNRCMYDSSDKWCCNWSFLINCQGHHTRWTRDLKEESSCKVAVRCQNPDLIFVHTQETLPCCRDTWPKSFQLLVKIDSWISTKYSSGWAGWHLSLQQESHLYFPKLDYQHL